MRLQQRDWPFTITLVLLAVATLVLAVADRSCQWRPPEAPGAHSIRIK